ncbi:tail fiber domain-containing protein [Burkholderia vietnamiensis]|uniref:tail fiber domain-containing protein n=1 Tax=Burkholderia vietnamiensis TaxID=60552 RepID=UPI00264EFDA9|nr:tail fiber domain-containing protein [Burkholderia vietnamiensis]MDN8036590.1 tail fiber domain-containing protein [Burkholderia vietnamiensis]
MTALQTINQGTAPAGAEGDTVRSAFSKVNSNVAVLNTQSALTSAAAISTAQALTSAHVGKRVNINLTTAGVINMPSASTCAADGVILLRNIGTTIATLAIASGSGDTVALSKLNPGETALMDTDGVHAWSVLMRGRTNGDNEVVNGNCTVNGNETVGGTLSVAGLSTFTGGASFGAASQATISSAGAYSGVGAAYTGNVSVGGTLNVTGQASFTLRPTFAGKTPWDSGNLPPSKFINSNGTNLINTWWDSAVSGFRITVDGNGYVGALVNTNTQNSIKLGWTGSAVSLVVDTTSLGTITTSSDYRAKQNIVSLPSGYCGIVKRMRPVSYKWRDFGLFRADGIEQIGFIAHELQEVIPSAVNGRKDAVDDAGNPQIQSLNMAPVVAALTAALQEVLARLEAIESMR